MKNQMLDEQVDQSAEVFPMFQRRSIQSYRLLPRADSDRFGVE